MIALCLPKLLPLYNPSEAGRAREQIQHSFSLIQVKTYIPKVPKHSLVPHHLNMITDSPPSSLMPEPEHSTEDTSHEALFANEGPEGPSLTHRAFVPMPPICSDSTVHSEAVSHQSHTAGLVSSEHPSDDDAKSTESIFLTQVNELPSSTAHRENLEAVNDQRRPSTAPRETKRTRRKQTATSLHNKYDGYEELLTVKPDPAFLEPKGIQKNAQALHRMLKQPLICRSSKPRLDTFQKPYVPKEKRVSTSTTDCS